MTGYTKYMYEKDMIETKKQLLKYVIDIEPLLSEEYRFFDILRLIKHYYPFEWQILEEKYQYYCKKDRTISKFHGKKRYNAESPESILKNLPKVKSLLDSEIKEKHRQQFSIQKQNDSKMLMDKKRMLKIKKREDKIEKAKEKAQEMEPEVLDKLMGLYDRKNTSQKDKVYILLELEKYYCPKTINFFKKIADSEYNQQLRNMAYYHLQSLGHYSVLRKQKYMQVHTKNKKRKQHIKDTAYDIYNVQAIPEELEYRIENSKDQKIKVYDYFISHSSIDYKSVQKLIKFLNAKDKNVYCDWKSDDNYLKRHLVCEATKNVINKRIEQSKEVVFVDSKKSRESCWVKYELNYALQQNKTILVVAKDSIDNDEIILNNTNEDWFVDEKYESILWV